MKTLYIIHYQKKNVKRLFKTPSIVLEILVKTGLKLPSSFHLHLETGTSSALYSLCRFMHILMIVSSLLLLGKSRHIQRIMFDFESLNFKTIHIRYRSWPVPVFLIHHYFVDDMWRHNHYLQCIKSVLLLDKKKNIPGRTFFKFLHVFNFIKRFQDLYGKIQLGVILS